MHKAFRSVLILAAVLFALLVPPRGFAAETSAADSDAVFNYAEAIYSQYLSPSGATSQSDGYYYYRYYSGTGAYIATANGRFLYLGPASSNQVLDLGAVSDWLTESQGLLAGAVTYTGTYPATGAVSYTTKDGRSVSVEAFPGQVQLFVDSSLGETTVSQGIQGLGGTVIAQIPKVGYYLASVAVGGEAAFIATLRQYSQVVDAMPNMPASIGADAIELDDSWWRTNRPVPLNVPPGVIIVDAQRGATGHAQTVGESVLGQGGTIGTVLITDDDSGRISNDKIVASIIASATGRTIFTPNEPILLNMSISGGGNTCNWGTGCGDTAATENQRHENWRGFASTVLNTIGGLPADVRDNLMLTTILGNGGSNLSSDVANLRSNATFDAILDKNVQFAEAAGADTVPVTGARPNGEYSNTANDLSVVRITGIILDSNGNLVNYGTSFSSPRIAAVTEQVLAATPGLKADQAKLANILAQNANSGGALVLSEATSMASFIKTTTAQVMSQTGVTEEQAKSAVLLAVKSNALHSLVASEAVAKAEAIKEAGTTDSSGAASVTGIAFTSTGGTASAVITPAIAGVTVQFTLSGTDGYFQSESKLTNSAGGVSFSVPAGASGVVDTFSVTAVLSGRVASATHTW